MGCKKNLTILLAFVGAMLFYVSNGYAYPSRCPDPGTGCTSCHDKPGTNGFPACPAPPPPACTDNDNDGFDAEGGTCGQVDCNDNNGAINPGAAEVCDGSDNNCNGQVDEGVVNACGTCGPAPEEVCDGTDNNCNGQVDEGLTFDADGDGYTALDSCAGSADDCVDNNPAINPAAPENCTDGFDNNCDNVIDDADSNAVGCPAPPPPPEPTCQDIDQDGYTDLACGGTDCNDQDAAISPNASEDCTDTVDNDCDGFVDAQDLNAVDCPVDPPCIDIDADTYSGEGADCGPVDCDDSDANVYPGATELCDDGMDNDCDGLTDEGCDVACPDLDGDGFTDALCGGTDCADDNVAVNPGAAEVCGNGVDENCNGTSDDACNPDQGNEGDDDDDSEHHDGDDDSEHHDGDDDSEYHDGDDDDDRREDRGRDRRWRSRYSRGDRD
jgi:hypothetical protein